MIRAAKAKETDREYLSQLKGLKWAQGVIPWRVGEATEQSCMQGGSIQVKKNL